MRMSAVMAQLENSSVSPTKMQICPGETRATIRGRSTRHRPQAAPCTLTAGREPPEAFPPGSWRSGARGICGLATGFKPGPQPWTEQGQTED